MYRDKGNLICAHITCVEWHIQLVKVKMHYCNPLIQFMDRADNWSPPWKIEPFCTDLIMAVRPNRPEKTRPNLTNVP